VVIFNLTHDNSPLNQWKTLTRPAGKQHLIITNVKVFGCDFREYRTKVRCHREVAPVFEGFLHKCGYHSVHFSPINSIAEDKQA
jgi:hypothetical protein